MLLIYMSDWHEKFDAFLGSQDHDKLEANIDYQKSCLRIGDMKIPFFSQYISLELEPFTQKVKNNVIKTPVDIVQSEVIVPEINLTADLTIPESLATAKDGTCIVPLGYEKQVEINFHNRIKVTTFVYADIQAPPKLFHDLDIPSVIRTNHLTLCLPSRLEIYVRSQLTSYIALERQQHKPYYRKIHNPGMVVVRVVWI